MTLEGGAENQRDLHWETTHPALKNRGVVEYFFINSFGIPHEPDILGGPGKQPPSLGLARTTLPHPKGASQPSRHPRRERARPLMQWSTSGRQGEHQRRRGGVPHSAEVPVRSNGTSAGSGVLEGWGTPFWEALSESSNHLFPPLFKFF